MSDDEQGKAPPEESPQDEPLWVKHFKAYDRTRGVTLDKFPDNWPNRFGLKWRRALHAGTVQMDWSELYQALVSWEISQRPPVEPQKILDFLNGDLTEWKEVMFPVASTMLYVMEHLPEKMDQALRDLISEGGWHTEVTRAAAAGREIDGFDSMAKFLAERERRAMVDRMNQRGVKPKSKKGQHSKWTPDTLRGAMRAAVQSLITESNGNGRKLSSLDRDLLKKLAAKLHRDHPAKIANSGDAVRKLISRFELQPDWALLKAEWIAAVNPPRKGQ